MFHRTSFNCRLKTRVTIIGFSVLLICCLLLYRALTSVHSTYPRRHHPLPTMEQKNSLHATFVQRHHTLPTVEQKNFPRQQLEQNNIPKGSFQANILDNNKIHNHLKYANVMPNEQMTETKLLDDNSKVALLKFFSTLYPTNWATAAETDEVALDLKYTLIDHGLESSMSCKQIDSLTLDGSVSHLGSSFLQQAYPSENDKDKTSIHLSNSIGGQSQLDKLAYVVKSLSSDRETKIACMKQVYEADRCAAMGNYRLLREVLLLSVLRHANIITMKGYCLRGSRVSVHLPEKGLVIVTEVGMRVTPSVISDMSWWMRTKMALQIGQLLLYLDSSPMGSLRLKTLSLQDFLLVQGQHLKLAELAQLELGDLPCTDNSECVPNETPAAEACRNGFCAGLNDVINFHNVATEVLLQVLHDPPGSVEEALVSRLRGHQLGLGQLLAELQVLSNKSEGDVPTHVMNTHSALVVKPEETHGDIREKLHKLEGAHRHDALKAANLEEALSNFVRYDHKNFAGIYDYLCAGSRVTWGCVHIVTSLLEAANLCLRDVICQCFVTFSSQPESDNLMTVVLKNDTDSSPHMSSGTTLFIRHSAVPSQSRGERGRETETKDHEKREASAAPASAELENCIDESQRDQEAARYVREKRLMTHLGLKGFREQVWRRSALRHHISGLSHLQTAKGGGGRFVANLTRNSENEADLEAKKVVFIAEDGPVVSHLAYAMVYHLDRLLGLYHTPPCVGKKLSAEDVDGYLSHGQWEQAFRSLIESDGTLSGILVVPMPKVMKNMPLSVEALESMSREVVPFSRSEKLQLEYILLWWLGNIGYTVSDHQGYKDHLIHFYADKAFAKKDLDMSGYLYHCQFPNVVFKSLACFQCSPGQETAGTQAASTQAAVCSLGQEVVRRARAMCGDDVDLFIHNQRVQELVAAINSAATSALHIIQTCIQTFGSHSVLY